MLARRTFLGAATAALFTPAVVKAATPKPRFGGFIDSLTITRGCGPDAKPDFSSSSRTVFGESGQVLVSQGAGQDPQWQDANILRGDVDSEYYTGDFTVEMYIKPDNAWHHYSQVQQDGVIKYYVDGAEVHKQPLDVVYQVKKKPFRQVVLT